MISDRSLAILHAIVSDFVTVGEPVGSKSIVEKYELGVSAATIRNDMALLEEEELIVAPHTSSGRIPTDKGYRLYVDTLSKLKPLTAAQRNAIERFLGEAQNLDDMMNRTVRLLADLTNQVAVIQYPIALTVKIRHVEFISLASTAVLSVLITNSAKVDQQVARLPFEQPDEAWLSDLKERVGRAVIGSDTREALLSIEQLKNTVEEWSEPQNIEAVTTLLNVLHEQITDSKSDRIKIAGAANLTRSEARSSEAYGGLPAMLEAIEEQVTLLRLIQELVTDQSGMGVSIGRENLPYGLPGASLIAAQYETGAQEAARLGVFGPTRMDYARSISAMRAVSRYVGKVLGEGPLA